MSGSTLKIIAVLSMLCDHVAKYILVYCNFARIPLFYIHGHNINLLFILSYIIGRIAFPVFAFLIVEGYLHTRNLKKYILNLLAFAILTIFPWNLLHGGLWSFHSYNVLFTFIFGILAIYGIDRLKGWKAFFCVTMALGLAFFMNSDYGISGILLIILYYAFRQKPEYQSLSLIACLYRGHSTLGVPLAALPVMLYNGRRGFLKGSLAKYIFYAFYPLHLWIIYLCR